MVCPHDSYQACLCCGPYRCCFCKLKETNRWPLLLITHSEHVFCSISTLPDTPIAYLTCLGAPATSAAEDVQPISGAAHTPPKSSQLHTSSSDAGQLLSVSMPFLCLVTCMVKLLQSLIDELQHYLCGSFVYAQLMSGILHICRASSRCRALCCRRDHPAVTAQPACLQARPNSKLVTARNASTVSVDRHKAACQVVTLPHK